MWPLCGLFLGGGVMPHCHSLWMDVLVRMGQKNGLGAMQVHSLAGTCWNNYFIIQPSTNKIWEDNICYSVYRNNRFIVFICLHWILLYIYRGNATGVCWLQTVFHAGVLSSLWQATQYVDLVWMEAPASCYMLSVVGLVV